MAVNIKDSMSDAYKAAVQFAFEWKRTPEWNAPQYTNPHATLWYVLAGSRRLIINGVAQEMKPGDIAVIPPYTSFYTEWTGGHGEPFHYVSASVSARIHGIEWSSLYGLPTFCRLDQSCDSSELLLTWRRLIKYWHQLTKSEQDGINDRLTLYHVQNLLFLQSYCSEWLASVLTNLTPHMTSPDPILDERVREVCAFIHNRYDEPIALKDMAQHVSVSDGHLRLLFRNSLDISPYKYLLQVRIEKAQELLLSTKLSLAEISSEVGFDDYGHFMATFRKFVGVAPSLYRKSRRLERE